ncbi:MAG: type II toxin-antitoxin system TacA family antitoxin [Acidimicrobiales bacterium]
MPVRSDRIEARLSPDQRERIDRAARFEGQTRSAFVVAAAVEKADQVIADLTTTRVPVDFFEQLLAALDDPGEAPALARAARRARRTPRLHQR